MQDPRLIVRELSILEVMDALTDKPGWNKRLFNEGIVGKWRQEALEKSSQDPDSNT
jgi:hypothetical protein